MFLHRLEGQTTSTVLKKCL